MAILYHMGSGAGNERKIWYRISCSKGGLHWADKETYVFQFKFKSNKGSKKLAEGDTVGGRG